MRIDILGLARRMVRLGNFVEDHLGIHYSIAQRPPHHEEDPYVPLVDVYAANTPAE